MNLDLPPANGRSDRLKQLRAFCHTAQLRNVSRAARRIFSTQPAVSRQIRALEAELGVALFERTGSRMVLTPAGEKLYRLARPLVEGMDRLNGTFAEQHDGAAPDTLSIGAGQGTAAFALPGYLRRFRERHPQVGVDIRIGCGRERVAWLRDYEMDLVVIAADVPPPDLEFHELFISEHVYITPEDHPLAGRDSVEFEEAASFPVVAHPTGTHMRDLLDMYTRLHGAAVTIVAEADGWNAIKTCVAAGVGVSVVPDLCLEERDRVWRIPFTRYVPPRRYGVLTRRDGLLSPPAKWFMEAAGLRPDDDAPRLAAGAG